MPPDKLISVIIPTYCEATNLGGLLASIDKDATPHEVIVVDADSADGSADVACQSGAIVIGSSRGRGVQLRCGAEQARGDILLFLHADSRILSGALARIRETLSDDSPLVGGNFRLLFDGSNSFSRRLTRFYAWIRRHGFYYGDSAIFIRRSVYDAIGGIRAIALMEDYDLVRRLERSGPTICIDDPPLITSSRKFEGRSSVAIIWGWLKIHALYHLGISPERLARIYYGNTTF